MAKLAAAAMAATIAATSAGAVTISVEDNGSFSGGGAFALETFESVGAGEVGDALLTSVGVVSSLGGTGTGTTVVGSGTQLAIKSEADGNLGGRTNVTPGGTQFLDSNDTFGMSLVLEIGRLFDTIAFTLTDAADQGATLEIDASNGESMVAELAALANANVQLVTVRFGQPIDSATITLRDDVLNDGFGIDDIFVGSVPLPASMLFMVSALIAVGVVRMRRRKAQSS